MTNLPTRQTPVDLNAVRTWAVFGVVFQHTLGVLCSSRDVSIISHTLYGAPSLTVLLLFSGMTMGIMRMPTTFREYPQYLKTHALPHLRVYTVFFLIQTALVLVNYQLGVHGMTDEPFSPRAIVRAYVLADGYGSLAIWYMYVLAATVAIWPLTRFVQRVPVWAVLGGLLAVGCCTPLANSDFACRMLYCMATIYLGRRVGWLRTSNHWHHAWIFGILYVVSTGSFLILYLNGIVTYHAWSYGTNIIAYALVMAARFSSAFFFISAVGMIGGRLSRSRARFAKGANASLYIYLIHRAVQLACLGLLINPVRRTLVPWGVPPTLAVVLLGTVLLVILGYYMGVFARRHPWLDYLVFGKGPRPSSSPWPWQTMRKAGPDAGSTGIARSGEVDARTSS